MKKYYWSLGLFVIGMVVGMKGAIVSGTYLIAHMALGAVVGFAIGSFLDWYDARRKRRPNTRT